MIVPEEWKGMEDPARDLSDDEIYKRMEEREPTEDLVGFGQAVNPWAKPGIQTVSGTIIFGGLIIFIAISLIHGVYYKGFVQHEWREALGWLFLLLIFFIPSLLISSSVLRGFSIESYDIYMGKEWLMAKGMYGKMKRIRYEDIDKVVAIEPLRYLIKPKLIIKSRLDPNFEIRINSVLIRFGEVIEHILERAENVTEVDVDKFARDWDQEAVYKKEPDWEIINQAKMRAEENRRKRGS